jgi:hypothetical protein
MKEDQEPSFFGKSLECLRVQENIFSEHAHLSPPQGFEKITKLPKKVNVIFIDLLISI